MTLDIVESKPRRRDKLVIMMDIISIARNATSKTHIMFRANLSFSQLNEYIEFLLQHRLLEKVAGKGKLFLRATQKGIEFMERQRQVICMFKDNGFGEIVETVNYSRNSIQRQKIVWA